MEVDHKEDEMAAAVDGDEDGEQVGESGRGCYCQRGRGQPQTAQHGQRELKERCEKNIRIAYLKCGPRFRGVFFLIANNKRFFFSILTNMFNRSVNVIIILIKMVEVIKEIVLLLLSLISSIDPYCNNLVKWQI